MTQRSWFNCSLNSFFLIITEDARKQLAVEERFVSLKQVAASLEFFYERRINERVNEDLLFAFRPHRFGEPFKWDVSATG